MKNHLEKIHNIVEQGPKRVPPPPAKKIGGPLPSLFPAKTPVTAFFLRKRLAEEVKGSLTPKELCCVLWATKGLAFNLIDDPVFRAIFGPCIPSNVHRHSLNDEMKALGEKVLDGVWEKLKGRQVTLGVDGWTNARHRSFVPFSPLCIMPFFSLPGKWSMLCSLRKAGPFS